MHTLHNDAGLTRYTPNYSNQNKLKETYNGILLSVLSQREEQKEKQIL